MFYDDPKLMVHKLDRTYLHDACLPTDLSLLIGRLYKFVTKEHGTFIGFISGVEIYGNPEGECFIPEQEEYFVSLACEAPPTWNNPICAITCDVSCGSPRVWGANINTDKEDCSIENVDELTLDGQLILL